MSFLVCTCAYTDCIMIFEHEKFWNLRQMSCGHTISSRSIYQLFRALINSHIQKNTVPAIRQTIRRCDKNKIEEQKTLTSWRMCSVSCVDLWNSKAQARIVLAGHSVGLSAGAIVVGQLLIRALSWPARFPSQLTNDSRRFRSFLFDLGVNTKTPSVGWRN